MARCNDLDAPFMAKPYGMQAGSGMHVHFSVLDEDGKNIYVGEGRALGTPDALGRRPARSHGREHGNLRPASELLPPP